MKYIKLCVMAAIVGLVTSQAWASQEAQVIKTGYGYYGYRPYYGYNYYRPYYNYNCYRPNYGYYGYRGYGRHW